MACKICNSSQSQNLVKGECASCRAAIARLNKMTDRGLRTVLARTPRLLTLTLDQLQEHEDDAEAQSRKEKA